MPGIYGLGDDLNPGTYTPGTAWTPNKNMGAETATVQILLGEGRMDGLVDGLRSVFLNGTPIENSDGSRNFKGVAVALVAGTNLQPSISGISGAESEVPVGVEVIHGPPLVPGPGITRSVSSNPSAVRVRISFPTLKVIDPVSGATSGAQATVRIERQNAAYTPPGGTLGAWESVKLGDDGVISDGPFGTKYTRSFRVELPIVGTWQIRVTRVSLDDADVYHQTHTWWDAYTEIIDAKFRYPNRSVLTLRLDAAQFPSMPTVTCDMRLSRVLVPRNYTPRSTAPARHMLNNLVAVDSVAKTFTRAAGSFITEGFIAGALITTSAFTNPGNNGTFVASAVTGLVLTCAAAVGLVTEAATGTNRTITSPSIITPASYATSGFGTSLGAWDGTFGDRVTGTIDQKVWCDNPAWAFMDAATADYGGGSFLSVPKIGKWDLYEIAQWCDELVPDGLGGTEPRMSCNLYFQTPQGAIKVLTQLASIWWGSLFYASSVITPLADSDIAASEMFTNANTQGFAYQGTAREARHTSAIAKFTNPDLAWTEDVAVWEPDAATIALLGYDPIVRYGFNSLDLQAVGCTSQGQALRLAKWAVLTELLSTDTVSFTSGLKASTVKPGDVIQIADQFRAGNTRSGGVVMGSTNVTNAVITLDAPVTLGAGTYILRCETATGMESKTVTTVAGTTSTITVAGVFSSAPAVGAGWLLQSGTVASLWRVLSLEKGAGLDYEVVALKHDPAKYAALTLVSGDVIKRLPIERFTLPPVGVALSGVSRILDDRQQLTLSADWTLDAAAGYIAQASRDYGPWETMAVSGASAYLDGIQPGTWRVRVAGDWRAAGMSPYVEASSAIAASATIPPWTATATANAAAALAAAPEIGTWATFAALPAVTGAAGAYPPGRYVYSSVIVDTAGDGTAGTLYKNVAGAWTRQAGALVAGKITAAMVVADFGTVNTIRSANWDGSPTVQSTLGYKLSGTAFTAKKADGSTALVQADFAGSMLIAGETAATIKDRVQPVNRILNGYFYADLNGWGVSGANPPAYSASSKTAGTGSATQYSVGGFGYTKSGNLTQHFSTPKPFPGQTIALAYQTGYKGTRASGDTCTVQVYILNQATGTETLLATDSYPTAFAALAWTARSVDITSYVSAGGSFSIRFAMVISDSGAVDSTNGVYVDEVSILS